MSPALPPARDADALLRQTLATWGGQDPLWLLAYGSLIWKREFEVAEARPARVAGWHRHFRMRSRVNRGSPEVPGLVLGLSRGGSCRGMVYRLPADEADSILRTLWLREMPTASYTPRWLRCQTPQGPVSALAFTLDADSPALLPRLADEALLHILRHASGRYGRTLDYLVQTTVALRAHGIHDHELERQLRLARRHGLL